MNESEFGKILDLITSRERSTLTLWGGSREVINFPWIFYVMRSLVPVGHFRNIYPGTDLLGLFGGLFSDAMSYCLPIVSCEMTRTK